MKKNLIIIFLLSAIVISNCKNDNSQEKKDMIKYPVTKKVNVVDEYYGEKIEDPYRWLENDTSLETAEWVKAQNEVTFGYLSKIPFRQKIKERLEKLWNYTRYGVPFKKGKYYFFFKNDGLQNQSVLYIQEGLEGEPRVFLDPNTFSKDGTISVSNVSISGDGKYLAYTISRGGSDWNEINIMEIPSGQKLTDEIKWVKFSGIAWYKDGFFYSRYDEPTKGKELSAKNEYHKVYYHKIGTHQKDDKLIYENKDYPLRNYTAITTEDERFLFISESESTHGNALYVKDLKNPNSKWIQIAEGFKNEYSVVGNIGDELYILTDYEAPKNKLICVNINKPQKENWKTIIAENKDVLSNANFAGGKIITTYIKDATHRCYIHDKTGKILKEIEMPCLGSISGLWARYEDKEVFYGFTSFTYPTTIYRYDTESEELSIFKKPGLNFNSSDYETHQIFYKSKDGTQVPMFIVHKKGIKKDGNNVTLLYGYGGFNVSQMPTFSASRLILLENGGILAVANIRGGGEYGEEWHQAGIKMKKQNVFDDFISAAEYLIKEKYTSSEKLAIMGGSNGGLLVGACMTQRPELFKVAIPMVGVLDMLRFHKFTIGWAWVSDYGSVDESKEMYKYLLNYSPLHNIKEGVNYPATLITTADHDDRVVPAHSFKFAATLQEKYKGPNPILIRIETMAGHGAGKPTSKLIEEQADIWSFIFYNTNTNPIY